MSDTGRSITAQLEALAALHDMGTLSDEEFEAAKNRVLGVEPAPPINEAPKLVTAPERAGLIAAAIIIALAAFGGGWWWSHSRSGIRVTGTLTLSASDGIFHTGPWQDGDMCTGRNGFDDIQAGASVTARDPGGKVIGVTQLGEGRLMTGAGCVFKFDFGRIHRSKFISIEATHRGEVQFNSADLKAPVALTLR